MSHPSLTYHALMAHAACCRAPVLYAYKLRRMGVASRIRGVQGPWTLLALEAEGPLGPPTG